MAIPLASGNAELRWGDRRWIWCPSWEWCIASIRTPGFLKFDDYGWLLKHGRQLLEMNQACSDWWFQTCFFFKDLMKTWDALEGAIVKKLRRESISLPGCAGKTHLQGLDLRIPKFAGTMFPDISRSYCSKRTDWDIKLARLSCRHTIHPLRISSQ
jgi:hypothetical protein